jgi:STAS domain-containing protein
LTIDLSDVTFMSSSGLSMLVEIRKAAPDAVMELRLDPMTGAHNPTAGDERLAWPTLACPNSNGLLVDPALGRNPRGQA